MLKILTHSVRDLKLFTLVSSGGGIKNDTVADSNDGTFLLP